jgi:hypothetical protein
VSTGINIDLETDLLSELTEGELVERYKDIRQESIDYMNSLLDPEALFQEHFKVPVYELDGKR